MKKLNNKIVFITGGNSGIGKACALQAAIEGANVVVADLAGADHAGTLKELSALGGEHLFVPIDVASADSVMAAVAATVQRFGRLDVALNNAGVGGPYSGIHDMPDAVWLRIIDINLTGVFYCVKHELLQFLKQGGGVIVNMASLAGPKAEHGLAPYTAAQHGVLGLAQNSAVQDGEQHTRASAICPYCVETPLIQQAPAALRLGWLAGTPRKCRGQSDPVANACICLVSDAASDCDGTQLILNRGVMC